MCLHGAALLKYTNNLIAKVEARLGQGLEFNCPQNQMACCNTELATSRLQVDAKLC